MPRLYAHTYHGKLSYRSRRMEASLSPTSAFAACWDALRPRCKACTRHASSDVQMSFGEAVAALKAAVQRGGRRYGAFASGVVRWEAPLPRDANALQWLQARLSRAALFMSPADLAPRRCISSRVAFTALLH